MILINLTNRIQLGGNVMDIQIKSALMVRLFQQ